MRVKIFIYLFVFYFSIMKLMAQPDPCNPPCSATRDFFIGQKSFSKQNDLYTSNQLLALKNYQTISMINTKSFCYSYYPLRDSLKKANYSGLIGGGGGFVTGFIEGLFFDTQQSSNDLLYIKHLPVVLGISGALVGVPIGYLIGYIIHNHKQKKNTKLSFNNKKAAFSYN